MALLGLVACDWWQEIGGLGFNIFMEIVSCRWLVAYCPLRSPGRVRVWPASVHRKFSGLEERRGCLLGVYKRVENLRWKLPSMGMHTCMCMCMRAYARIQVHAVVIVYGLRVYGFSVAVSS